MLKPYIKPIEQIAIVYAYSGLKKDRGNRIYSIAATILDPKTPRRDFSSHVYYTLSTERERYYSNISKEILLQAPPKEEVISQLKVFLHEQPFIFVLNNHNNVDDLLNFTGNLPIIDLGFAAEFYLPYIESYTAKTLWEYLFKKNRERISFMATEMVELSIEFLKFLCGQELNDRIFPRAASIRYYLKKSNTLFGTALTHITKHYAEYFPESIGLNPCYSQDTEDWEQFLDRSKSTAPENNVRQPYKTIPIGYLDGAYKTLAQVNRDIRYRESQVEYATQVTGALNDSAILTIEAGTGTGKTQGYLIPVMEFLYRNPSARIAISTYTKNLQDQIFHREIKIAKSFNRLYEDIPVAVLKGKSNYICVEKLGNMQEEDLQGKKLLAWLYFLNVVFHFRDSDGDFVGDKVKFYLEDGFTFHQMQNELTSKTGCDPKHAMCPAQIVTSEACFARLLVTNHHKLAILETDPYLTGRYRNLVIDEANHFENAIRNAFGIEVNARDIIDSFDYIELTLKRVCAKITGNYLKDLESIFSTITNAKQKMRLLGEMLKSINQNRNAGEIKELPSSYICSEEGGLQSHISSLRNLLKDVSELLRFLKDEDVRKLLKVSPRTIRKINDTVDLLDDYRESLTRIEKNITLQNNVIAYQVFHKNWTLILQQVDVADLVSQNIYSNRDAIIFTSATLSHNESFEMFRTIVGIENKSSIDSDATKRDYRFARIASPFSKGLMEILVPADAVSGEFSNKNTWTELVSHYIPELVKQNKGRSLVLFPSYDDLKQIADRVSEEITSARYPLLIQQAGCQTNNISDEFRAIKESVLFGVDTFWYGVDYKGDTLTQVIITRIPYASPSNPIHMARKRIMSRSDYQQRYLYDTSLKLRQGIGRLIRSETDTGKVIILDSRYRQFCRHLGRQYALANADMTVKRSGRESTESPSKEMRVSLSEDISKFFSETCECGPRFLEKGRSLHRAYRAWRERYGSEHYADVSRRIFWDEISKLNGITKINKNPCLFSGFRLTYEGIKLADSYTSGLELKRKVKDENIIADGPLPQFNEKYTEAVKGTNPGLHPGGWHLEKNHDPTGEYDLNTSVENSENVNTAESAVPLFIGDQMNNDLWDQVKSDYLISTSKIASHFKIKGRRLFSVLTENGFIEKTTEQGYRLTAAGKELGGKHISTLDNRSYIVWPRHIIQNHIFKALAAIALSTQEDVRKHKRKSDIALRLNAGQDKLSNAYEKWSPEGDAELLRLYHTEKIQVNELAIMFQRTDGAVRARLKHLLEIAQNQSIEFRKFGTDIDDQKKSVEDAWIKGKISESGEKTYYMPGEIIYLAIEPDAWFATEEYALRAGFKKSVHGMSNT